MERIEEILEAMDEVTYETIGSENVDRMDARWAGDTEAEAAHEARLTALLAEYGITLAQYEEYLGYYDEEDWSDPVWDE